MSRTAITILNVPLRVSAMSVSLSISTGSLYLRAYDIYSVLCLVQVILRALFIIIKGPVYETFLTYLKGR